MIEQIGLDEAKAAFSELPANLRAALIRSINNVVPAVYSLAVERITEKKGFTKAYVKSRLYVSQRASNTDPMAVISGRRRETQMIRFSGKQLYTTAKLPGKKRLAGVSVRINMDEGPKVLKHMWVIKLKRGTAEAKFGLTMGIAERTGKERDDFEIKYSTSVADAFSDVKDEIRPEVDQLLEDEWRRQMRSML